MIPPKVTSTIDRTLRVLRRIGSEPVDLRLSPELFPAEVMQKRGWTIGKDVAVGSSGDLVLHLSGPDALALLNRLTRDLLAVALEQS